MHINDWIEIDKDLKWYIDEKTRVIKERGQCLHVLIPPSRQADVLGVNDHPCVPVRDFTTVFLI